MPPASIPITRLGGMAGRYTEVCDRPESGPSGVQGLPLRASARSRAAATSTRSSAGSARHGQASPTGPAARPITPGRVLKWVALAIVGWLLLSLVLFLVSAQLQDGVSDDAERALSSGGSMLGGSNILVLGSDARTGDSIDESAAGPSRADTIMLVHAELGGVRKLSIPRDTEAEIPGHGTRKINAAYALGGPALTIETVEGFLGNGLEINHLVEVDFEDFPALIDALGGITVDNKTRICSPPFDNFWKGLHFRKGEIELDGKRALGSRACARTRARRPRTTAPAPRASRRCCARSARRPSRPSTFFRLPWVSWRAPKALKTDMKGPALMAPVRRRRHRQLRRDRGARGRLLRPRGRQPGRRPARARRRSTSWSNGD